MDRLSKEDYNNEPVFYCKKCLSLNIRHVRGIKDTEYCDECGSTDVETTNIENWENMYEARYGHKFLDKY